ncbi:MAG: hypothetical protein GX823_00060 [Clostridiales bacterium]|nr:hypothetical protein [Clostridiales bacterium]
MLDDKEKRLLDTFRALEDAMDDYYALVEEAKAALEKKSRELENRLLLKAEEQEEAAKPVKAIKKAPSSETVEAVPKPEPEPPGENRLSFEQVFSDAASNVSAKSQLHGRIVDMSRQGRTRAEIAKELKITQTEVELVTGMNKEPGKADENVCAN